MVVRKVKPKGKEQDKKKGGTAQKRSPGIKLTLPTQLSEPRGTLLDYMYLLYGREKIGKTTFLRHWPDAFFLMFEEGGKALRIYQRPVPSWSDFKQYVRLLKGPEGKRFKTVVIDTAEIAFKRCQRYVCAKLGIDHPSEGEWGSGWDALREEFAMTFLDLQMTGKGIVFISHVREKTVRKRGGGESERIVPTMTGQCKDIVEAMVDVIGYYGFEEDGESRRLWIRGDDFVTAGCRLEENFKGYRSIPMGRSSEESFANFEAAFNNELPKEEPKPKRKTATVRKRKGGAKRKTVVRKRRQ